MENEKFYEAPKSTIIDTNNDPKKPGGTIISVLIFVSIIHFVVALLIAVKQNLEGPGMLAYAFFSIVLIPLSFMGLLQFYSHWKTARARMYLIVIGSVIFLLIQIAYLLK